MTYNEIADLAIARASEFYGSVPQTRSLLLRRIGARQRQLFARANAVDPDYFGMCGTGSLDASFALNLLSIVDPIAAVDRVTRVTIAAPGTSTYPAGTAVHLVREADAESFFAPRMTYRGGALLPYGSDLQGVVSIKVQYARLPLDVAPTSGASSAELPLPWQELLVIDGAKYLIRKAVGDFGGADERKKMILDLLTEEEKEMEADYLAQVSGFAAGRESRFQASGNYTG